MTKTCFKCGIEQPITEFYRHPRMGDGHLGKCKACARYDVRENRIKRIAHYTIYDRERKAGKKPRREPHKAKATAALNGAVARGRIMRRPCEICGNPKSEGHHADYGKPLDVMWLCRKHHADWHRANGRVA